VNEHTFHVLKEIESDDELELVRSIRNECRMYMTRDTREISESEQRLWYNLLDKEKNKIFLLYAMEFGSILYEVGYAVVRQEGSIVVLSGGLTSSERGNGIGEVLFSSLLDEAVKFGKPIFLEVLKSNMPARTIYDKLGFVEVNETNGVITMEYVDG